MEHRGVVVTAVIEIERGRPAVRSVTVEDRGEVGLQTRDLRDVPLRVSSPTRLTPSRCQHAWWTASSSFRVPFPSNPRSLGKRKRTDLHGWTGTRSCESSSGIGLHWPAAIRALRVTVGAAMGMSSAKVGTLLRRARALGLLGQAEWGRAGELTEEGEHEK